MLQQKQVSDSPFVNLYLNVLSELERTGKFKCLVKANKLEFSKYWETDRTVFIQEGICLVNDALFRFPPFFQETPVAITLIKGP